MGDTVCSPAASDVGSPGAKGPTALVITANRVKNLVREDVEVKTVSTEACFAAGKAAELLLEGLAARAAAHMQAAGRGSLEYGDVAAAVADSPALAEFLGDVVPPTVKAAALLPAMS